MAASSSSPSLPNANHTNKYDVFLSFRGEDTRHNFTDHLYHALVRAGLRTFRDNDSIGRGQLLKPEIETAIKQSRASVIVLSENYADSRWCLDELVLILEQRRKFDHFALPVFLGVDPSDVRNRRGRFSIDGSKWAEVDVNRWKAALTLVADLTGMVVSGSETEFIKKIVHTVDSQLDLKLLSTPAYATGIDSRAKVINTWLKNEQSNSNVLAICGMGGIGKTTLSQYMYNSNKQIFESSSFLEEIGKHCQQPLGLLGLQKQLLGDIFGGSYEKISSVFECTSKIEEALQMKRVLIVLDDIDDNDQLAALLGTKTFHTQSKIIITTRLLNVDAWFQSISQRCQVYVLDSLDHCESVELLSCHAFGSKVPMEGFKELAVALAMYCGGNPLALKVLGSSLFVSAEDEQKKSDMIEMWRSTLSSLNSLKGDIYSKIQCVLRRSFDSLPRDIHRELFLHISFYFVGEYADYVVTILEHDWHAKAGIMTLINRCLLTVSPSNKVMMHQLLQEMGIQIVRGESKDPTKRSRVVQDDESYHVLAKGSGSKTLEGLALNVHNLKQGIRSKQLALKTGSLAKINKLKLLQLNHVKLSGSYKSFPKLRWLCWHGCPLKTIPCGLLMTSLVAIDMTNGHFREFESPVVLNKLKILILKGCETLVSVRNLHRLPNLESLILRNCWSLIYVCKSIRGLGSLKLFDLTGCSKFWKALLSKKCVNRTECLKALYTRGRITQQTTFSLPDSLKFLFLSRCNLKYNSNVSLAFTGQPFFCINLSNNLFECLPNYINLQTLRVLDVTCCYELKSLLCLPSTLEELYTYSCYSLEKITFQSARFRLREFGYEGCNRLSEIQGLFTLVSIEEVDDADLRDMKWIKSSEYGAVNLVGDDIVKQRSGHMLLYEFGIISTYLSGIIYQPMIPEYTSSSSFLSFIVPSCPTKRKINGLNVSSLYKSTGEDILALLAKVSNKTKDLTWIYNPVVYSKPEDDEDAMWLSYWPIGYILDAGDEVNVEIIVGNGFIVSGCCATLVYIDGELCQENCKYMINEEEVIGGDLSEFELTKGAFYLCRRDFFKSMSPDWLKMLVGDTIHYKELKGWKKSRHSHSKASYSELKTFRGYYQQKIVLKVGFRDDINKIKGMKAVSKIYGVESIAVDMKDGKLTVTGEVDPLIVVACLRKLVHTEIISVGPDETPIRRKMENLSDKNISSLL